MHSEREKRVQQAAEIENEILNYESAQETNAKTLAALRLAKEVLQETPRKLRNCNLELHRFPVGIATVEQGDCSACGETVTGYEQSWHFCPACGSQILKAAKEQDPRDRMARVAIKEAVQLIGGK
jgi:rRNA maturation endonuclease Nob1